MIHSVLIPPPPSPESLIQQVRVETQSLQYSKAPPGIWESQPPQPSLTLVTLSPQYGTLDGLEGALSRMG